MNRFDRLLDDKHFLDRQTDKITDAFSQRIKTAKSHEELDEILTQGLSLLKPFGEMYEALGKATVKEYNRPRWKVW